MKPDVTIAEMTLAYYDSVRDLIASTEGLTLRSADSREATDCYLKRNPGLRFVARSGGRLVGCVMCGHYGVAALQRLAVAPKARHQGIAAALVERCIATLPNWELKRPTLTF